MKRVAWTFVVLMLLGVCFAPLATAAPPKPEAIPYAWQLKFDPEAPRALAVRVPGADKPQTFWYMIYTVTNTTGQDQIFIPEFLLYTNTGQVLPSDRGVPSNVFRKIQSLHNDPLLQTTTGVTGKILQGRDNAKRGVAIWPDFDKDAGQFDVFVGGLSGETQTLKLPVPVKAVVTDLDGKAKEQLIKEVILSKTLMLRYGTRGDKIARPGQQARQIFQTWVMRSGVGMRK